MQIRSLTVGPIATCCYILSREDRPDCLVIDPGAEPERILRAAGEKRIAAILLTHGHFDHIEAVAALKGEDTPVLIHELDAPMLGDPNLNVSRPLMHRDITAPPATDLLREAWRSKSCTRPGIRPAASATVLRTSFLPGIRSLSTAGAGRIFRAATSTRFSRPSAGSCTSPGRSPSIPATKPDRAFKPFIVNDTL